MTPAPPAYCIVLLLLFCSPAATGQTQPALLHTADSLEQAGEYDLAMHTLRRLQDPDQRDRRMRRMMSRVRRACPLSPPRKYATPAELARADSLAGPGARTNRLRWACRENAYALATAGGRLLSGSVFTWPAAFRDNGAAIAIHTNGFYYYISAAGKIEGPYRVILPTNHSRYFVNQYFYAAFFDGQFRRISPWYDNIQPFQYGLAQASYRGKAVWIDTLGRQVVRSPVKPTPVNRPAAVRKNNPAPFKENGKWGLIDSAGNTLLEPQFDLLDRFQTPYPVALVKRDGKYGLIHRSGKILLPPEYDYISEVAVGKPNKMQKNGFWGLIDTGGQIIAPAQFESVGTFWGNVGWVKYQGAWGLYDLAGFFRLTPRFRQVDAAWSEGTAAVSERGEWDDWGIIDTSGRFILPPRFEAAKPFSDGLAAVRTGNKYGYVDTSGHYRIEPHFLMANNFDEERAWVMLKDGRNVLIDHDGRQLLVDRFDHIEPFQNGIALVGRMPPGGSHYVYGLVHRDGRLLVAPQFDYIPEFYNGLAWLNVDGGWNLLDTSGHFLFDTPFDEINEGYTKGTAAAKGGRYAWIDSGGKLQLPALFDHIYFVEFAIFIVKNQKWGMIDSKGKVVLQPQFNNFDINRSLLPAEFHLSMPRGSFSLNCKGEMVVIRKNTDCGY